VSVATATRVLPSRGHRGLHARHALVGLVALALLIRVVVVLATPHYAPQTDALDYDRIAVSLARHDRLPPSILVPHGPSAFRPPLFPLALAAVYKVVGTDAATRWEAGRLLCAALGALTVALIALIALRLWGRAAAVVTAAIASVYPPLIMVGSSLMSESLFIPLILASVLAALNHRRSRHRWRWAVISGLLGGLAALSHGNGLMLAIPLALLVWTELPRRSWRAAAVPAALLATMLATLVPWTVRNALVFHQFVPLTTQTGYGLAGVYDARAAHDRAYPALWLTPIGQMRSELRDHPGLNEAQLSDRLSSSALGYIGRHPLYPVRVVYWSSLRMLNLTGFQFERVQALFAGYPLGLVSPSIYGFWVLGILALVGILAESRARRAPAALWLCPVLVLLPSVVLLGNARYRSPADPFVVMLGSLGVVQIARWLVALCKRRA
jgi:4-amino-4-deoxy-L-arabinose transferase-like glycosyltransferase